MTTFVTVLLLVASFASVSFAGALPMSSIKEMNLTEDYFHYFAFGSNLLDERIKVQIKGAEFESTGVLTGYRLAFYDEGKRWRGAVASITEDPNSHVWGCVWRVPNSFAAELDKQESGYHRLNVTVKMSSNGSAVECRTYQYSNPERQARPPSPHYKHVIVSGAIEHELPNGYIEMLQKIKDNGYEGPVELDLDVLKELNNGGA
uniref:gamma-glutamylcyclotransferase n=1 Tax=Steinernema glaseri TaxID=37863 RepID=A0A1I7YR00_9BILA